jgi:DNA-binding CsgD family transcriptional regulator
MSVASSSDTLTPRERQVLALLAEGRSSKEISSVLNVAIATVSFHRKSLCRKLDVHSGTGLVHLATTIRWAADRLT